MTAPARSNVALLGSHPGRETETLAGIVDPPMEVRARHLLEHLSARGQQLSTAESCTGGLLASLFTDLEGVSHVFDRGLVTYAGTAKADLLGVTAEDLDRHGPVSRPIAIAMAEGLLDGADAHVGVAVTGFSGTGREPGLVHLALARSGKPTAHRERRFGTVGRGQVRVGVLRATLQLMEEIL